MPKCEILWEDEEVEGCDMEGCRGHLVKVRWANGEVAFECSAALATMMIPTEN